MGQWTMARGVGATVVALAAGLVPPAGHASGLQQAPGLRPQVALRPTSQPAPEPARTSPAMDLARNPTRRGYPHPLASDSGWGGGRDKWDIVDGIRVYGIHTNGLAFTGGAYGWLEPCGWRQATIDFGRPVTFDSVSVWWAVGAHIPTRYRIRYLEGDEWKTVFSTDDGPAYLRPGGEDTWWNRITDNSFPAVTSSQIRLTLNNCDGLHGWIHELEVYGPDPPAGAQGPGR